MNKQLKMQMKILDTDLKMKWNKSNLSLVSKLKEKCKILDLISIEKLIIKTKSISLN